MRNIGIEVEVESKSVSIGRVQDVCSMSGNWVVEHDGSLRAGDRGWEIKTLSGNGLPFDVAIQSLEELYPVLANSSGTWRAAIHVHVDAGDLSARRRGLVLALAYALDDSIFELFAPERRESNFCIPLASKAPYVLSTINTMRRGQTPSGYGKYTSINSNSLNVFGTFEFRHMKTPAAGRTAKSVHSAIKEITKFATMAHEIVDSVTGLRRVTRTTFIPRYLELVENSRKWGSLGLRIDEEAVMEVINELTAPPTVDPAKCDPYSILELGSSGRERSMPDEPRVQPRRPSTTTLNGGPQRDARGRFVSASATLPSGWLPGDDIPQDTIISLDEAVATDTARAEVRWYAYADVVRRRTPRVEVVMTGGTE